MNNANWKGYAELVGIAAIVASLIFVGLQMQQTEDIARYERYSDAMSPIEIANTLADHSDVWLRGCAGDDLSQEEWLTFVQLVDVINVRRNARWEINRLIDAASQAGPQVAIYRHAIDLYSNPGMLKAWQARSAVREQTGHYFDEDLPNHQNFTQEVLNALENIRSDPPEVLSNGPLCGIR